MVNPWEMWCVITSCMAREVGREETLNHVSK